MTLRLLAGEEDRTWESLNKFGAGARWLKNIPGVTVRRIEGLDHPVVSLESQRLALKEIGLFLGLDESEPLHLFATKRPGEHLARLVEPLSHQEG